MKTIESFRGDYFFLSNFYPCQVILDSFVFKSAEAAYQSKKSKNWDKDVWKFAEMTAAQSKQSGQELDIRDDWAEIKIDVMRDVLLSKFENNKDLKSKLIMTGDAKLVEGNDWGDTFWGVCNGRGQNWLGFLLMDLRDQYKKESDI